MIILPLRGAINSKKIIIFSLKNVSEPQNHDFRCISAHKANGIYCQATGDACISDWRCLYMSSFLLLPPHNF